MRVTIESIGGLAGQAVTVARYDTREVSEGETERLRQAIGALSRARPTRQVGADLPAYRITVEDTGDTAPRVVEVDADPATNDPLALLLRGPREP
jgi:hypothetical protein